MFDELNKTLRVLIALTGGLFLIMYLLAKMDTDKDNNDGFQTKEFDDIW